MRIFWIQLCVFCLQNSAIIIYNRVVTAPRLSKQSSLLILQTLYKRIGYAIIPKPHFSSHEGINSRCRRFNLLLFVVFAQYFAAMIDVVAAHVVAGDRPTVTVVTAPISTGRLFVHSTYTCTTLGLRDSLCVFFAYKTLLGRNGTRTRERKCFRSIRTVWDISRNDRARIATCSLQTATDLRRIIV